MNKLAGRVALVTGAGRGIGRAVAQLLAQEGAAVVINDLGAGLGGDGQDEAIATQAARAIDPSGERVVANTGSVSDYEAAGKMVQQAIDEFGRLDIVVNIAGILRDRMIYNMTEAEFDAVTAVHLTGTFNTCRHASVIMRKQGHGRIINFSSVSAWGSPGQPNYGAAKYGILGFTATLANSLGRSGVTANAILPYATTRMIDSTPRGRAIAEEQGKPPSELAEGTEGDPANVAPMVAYLATDDAAGINGHFFGVRGNTIALYSHWELAGVLRAGRRWQPAEIAAVFPETFGQTTTIPAPVRHPGEERPLKGAAALQADPASWEEFAPGVELWMRQQYYGAK
ncbi:MAG TPA: SDR family oxidoreductase [Thermomicrobiales bacterium]|jgi:NAD(P)-dependent dehydrogenase (short-subunit alcohol dehydrogenase family)